MSVSSNEFTVYAATQRPQQVQFYTGTVYFNALGKDMTGLLREAARELAILIGNSSGGVLTC